MKKNIILIVFLALSHFAQAQTKSPDYKLLYKNAVSFEAGGHGLVYSINYERNIVNTKWYKLSQQIGLALYPSSFDLRSNIWIPYSINQLFSYHQHHLETGIGVVLTHSDYGNLSSGEGGLGSQVEVFYAAKVGYRYQKPNGRMTYKLLFTPIWEKEWGYTEFHPLGAFSIGYNF